MRIRNAWAIALVASTVASPGCGGQASDTDQTSQAPDADGVDAGPPGCGFHAGDLVIGTRADVVSGAGVGEVGGDLRIEAVEPYEIRADDLPCLTAIRGSLTIGSASISTFASVTLGNLETIDGGLTIGYVDVDATGGTAVAFPRLRRVGTPASARGLNIAEARLIDSVEFPVLEEVNGDLTVGWLISSRVTFGALRTVLGSVSLGPAADLQALDLGELPQISGTLSVLILPHVPYSFVTALGELAEGGSEISQVGCRRADGDMSPDCEAP